MGFIISVLVNAAALWVAIAVLDGLDFSGEWFEWLLLALVFGVVNAVVKPILKLLTLPITMVTLGLFLIVLNALMLYLTSWIESLLGQTLTISSFIDALLGGIIIAVVGMVLHFILGRAGASPA